MLTDEDIQKLIAAEKEIFYTKPELDKKFKKLEDSFASLQTSVDNLANKFAKYHEEQIAQKHRLDQIEQWVRKAASKLGLDYNP